MSAEQALGRFRKRPGGMARKERSEHDRSHHGRLPLRVALLALATLGACGGGDVTQILVEIDAAEDVRAMASFVRVRVEVADQGGAFTRAAERGDLTIDVSTERWPRRHVIAPLDGDATRRYRVTAIALDDAFRTLSESRKQSGYVAGETRVLHLFLPGGACLGVTCPEDRTCDAGLCREIPDVPPQLLPRPGEGEMDGGPMDAGMDAGECDTSGLTCEPEGLCETATPTCVDGEARCLRELRAAGDVCRPSAHPQCDPAEVCDGASSSCPPDVLADTGVECDEGYCVEGVCGACEPGVACTTANPCEVGAIECDPETGAPTCVAVRAADAGTICRPARGPCDAEEVCEGMVCPPDAKVAAGMVCRGAAGSCDVAEVCDGTRDECPSDAFVVSGTECRTSQGGCDPAETCTGTSASCPADAVHPDGFVCRPAASDCDLAEVCDGSRRSCPDDAFRPFGTPCGSSQVCDGAGMCVSSSCGAACDTGRACEVGVVDCSGGSPTCVASGLRPAGHVCRPSAGSCDVAEVCSGSAPTCPADAYQPSTTICREAAGTCDVPESCTGTSPSCPSDAFRPSTHVCRAAMGDCDRAETCSGSSAACPPDTFFGSSRVCRPASGLCDQPEACSGTSATCPPDLMRPAGFVCRPGAHPTCDFDETCNGTSARCPDDEHIEAGEACRLRPLGYDGICGEPLESATPHRCMDLVLSELQIAPEGFIEIYNRFCLAVPLHRCGLVLRSAGVMGDTTHRFEFPAGAMIPGGGFYLVHLGLALGPDVTWPIGASLTGTTGVSVELVCLRQRLDLVGVGNRAPDFEGEPVAFCVGGSVERKAVAASTAATLASGGAHETWGNPHDTDDNAADFVCQTAPFAQSSHSPPEPIGCE